ncbi:hypothetical protein HDU76_004234 [Blyttiomyces sp. JEL0837]|nr:hypothetical protein HDU76_004234 [Blyttiomyces sp. JEL0837]
MAATIQVHHAPIPRHRRIPSDPLNESIYNLVLRPGIDDRPPPIYKSKYAGQVRAEHLAARRGVAGSHGNIAAVAAAAAAAGNGTSVFVAGSLPVGVGFGGMADAAERGFGGMGGGSGGLTGTKKAVKKGVKLSGQSKLTKSSSVVNNLVSKQNAKKVGGTSRAKKADDASRSTVQKPITKPTAGRIALAAERRSNASTPVVADPTTWDHLAADEAELDRISQLKISNGPSSHRDDSRNNHYHSELHASHYQQQHQQNHVNSNAHHSHQQQLYSHHQHHPESDSIHQHHQQQQQQLHHSHQQQQQYPHQYYEQQHHHQQQTIDEVPEELEISPSTQDDYNYTYPYDDEPNMNKQQHTTHNDAPPTEMSSSSTRRNQHPKRDPTTKKKFPTGAVFNAAANSNAANHSKRSTGTGGATSPSGTVRSDGSGSGSLYYQQQQQQQQNRSTMSMGGVSGAGGNARRLLPEGERLAILAGLRSNYESLMALYNRLPVTTDTASKISRKLSIEKQLQLLEDDIKRFSNPNIIIEDS